MKVLVTGGAGFIGSHACKALAASGLEPIAYDNLSRGNRWAVKWGALEVGDIADHARLLEVLDFYRPVAIIHFAAFAYVGESVKDPASYYQNNIAGSVNLLRAVLRSNPIPVVFSSTCATYGVPEELPITERHPQQPINPYGLSKLVVEKALVDFDAAYGLRSVALRYFNAAGADPDGEIGEAHSPETHLIPLVLEAAMNKTAVMVFGNDHGTRDGTCVRDYVHVTDLADAHVRALRYLLDGGKSCALNLANSRGHSVLEVIRVAEQVCDTSISVIDAPRRAGDPPILVGSADRAKDTLGWEPARSDLSVQIADAWNWMNRGGREMSVRQSQGAGSQRGSADQTRR